MGGDDDFPLIMELRRRVVVLLLCLMLLLSAPVAYACGLALDSDKWEVVEAGDALFEGVPSIETSRRYSHLTEVAAVELERLKGVNVTTADVYAHKGYAYVGTHRGLCSNEGVRVFDLSDPSNPVEVAVFANDIPGTWQEKVIVKNVSTPYFKGDLAAVSVQRCDRVAAQHGGTVLYDVTDPTNPQFLSFWKTPTEVLTGTHELYLTTQGNRVLLLTADIYADYYTQGEQGDFSIVDVTDPSHPTTIFNWDPREIIGHEYNGYNFVDEEGTPRIAFAHSVITDVNGKYAYVSYWDLGTIIFDISNPEEAQVVGRTSFERHVQGAAHSAALARGGNILIETREVFNPDPADPEYERGWGYTRIYDISDKSNPVLISDFRTTNSMTQIVDGERQPGTFTVHDPKVRGNTLYLSHYADGIRVVDISNPAQPVEVASYVPDRSNIWGVFVDRNYILGSDMGTGLKILQRVLGHSQSHGKGPQ
ncbi:hypothetical protein GCM10010965_29610 [Caldalkalibacillus thermarum]|uniref:LVIVD repeat-containing protein n=1 Tax=Caldalkalibacillus thermarum TaxID=296745 RepID=UPI0019BFAC0C|nr:hypothetical protein [Caldalkalibacillus thermarum]GGK34748.1 hypothetical protein GCM10010965_29610 [Caldalkalibacillus thermarum]